MATSTISDARRGSSRALRPLVFALVLAMSGTAPVWAAGKGDRLEVDLTNGGSTTSILDRGRYSLWVGEVEVEGHKTVWLELIDSHGEVVYDSEVRPNESHLLPDGRVITVRPQVAQVAVSKIEDRISGAHDLFLTRAVATVNGVPTDIEYGAPGPVARNDQPGMPMLQRFALATERVWDLLAQSVTTVLDRAEVAWSRMVERIRACSLAGARSGRRRPFSRPGPGMEVLAAPPA